MSQSTLITFILVKSYNEEFVKDFLVLKNFVTKSNALVITEVSALQDLLDGRPPDYAFRLIIHEGIIDDLQKFRIGNVFANDVLDRFPGVKKSDLVFLTRNQDLFRNQKEFVRDEDGMHLNFNRCSSAKILEEIPAFTVGQFHGTPPKGEVVVPAATPTTTNPADSSCSGENYDFAIITALYEDEFAVYRDKCRLSGQSKVHNGSIAVFKEPNELGKDEDYKGEFLAVYQTQMGLVDAALHSAQIITEYNPKFLVMGGVCGGDENKVKLYDVIIPTVVYDYATGKFKEGKFDSKGYKTSVNSNLTKHIENNKKRIITNMHAMIDEGRNGLLSKDFDIHISEFAAGPWVIGTKGFLTDYLSESVSKDIKGLEMESYSVIRAREIFPSSQHFSLVVKSVMDYTNEAKSDGPNKEIKQGASYISYLCIRAMMPVLLEFDENFRKWNKT